jgi:hypothetical protein
LAERYKRVDFLSRQVKSKGIGDLIETMRFVWNVMPDAELLLAAFAFLKLRKLISRLLHFQRYGASRSGTSVQYSSRTSTSKKRLFLAIGRGGL